MDNNNIMNTADFDGLHEECGVFGAYDFDGEDVASTIYYGLFALQHRGQESCGIAVSDTNGPKGKVMSYKDMGLVNEVFNPENLEKLKGNGHSKLFNGDHDGTEYQGLYIDKETMKDIINNNSKNKRAIDEGTSITLDNKNFGG